MGRRNQPTATPAEAPVEPVDGAPEQDQTLETPKPIVEGDGGPGPIDEAGEQAPGEQGTDPVETPTDIGGGEIVDLIDDEDADGQAGSPDPSEADAEAQARADALAALAAGGPDASDSESEGDAVVPAPAAPGFTGVEHSWGGDVPAIVVSSRFNAIVDGAHLTAREGDRVLVTEATAERGVTLGCLYLEQPADEA